MEQSTTGREENRKSFLAYKRRTYFKENLPGKPYTIKVSSYVSDFDMELSVWQVARKKLNYFHTWLVLRMNEIQEIKEHFLTFSNT